MERPALKRLLAAVEAQSVDCVVVYKVDRLSRSLTDFARIIESFDRNGVSFVSVTQQFNTTTSLGRLTLNTDASVSCLSGQQPAVAGREPQEPRHRDCGRRPEWRRGVGGRIGVPIHALNTACRGMGRRKERSRNVLI
jgi:hypothetical protein